MDHVDFAFVWKEEQQKLHDFAAQVPVGGVIVEIGTAVGGTSVIFSNATKGSSVSIYTVDPHPSRRAANNLAGTGVSIINLTSETFHQQWPSDRPIDLLYIDGDHTFKGIFTDFTCWHKNVALGGRVVFHDYDPKQRGGIAHFAIRVFLETLARKNIFLNYEHEYKLFSAGIRQGVSEQVTSDHFVVTIRNIFKQAEDKAKKLFDSSIADGMKKLIELPEDFDSLEACVAVEYALRHDFECLDIVTHSFYDFRRWAEALSFLDHGTANNSFVDYIKHGSGKLSIAQLSQMIALIQLRISLAANLLGTLVSWKP
jgi:hypothetical protein